MLVIDSPADLEPIIATAVNKALEAIEADSAKLGDRLAFSEPEGARMLGLKPHQLRDERLRGRIGASVIVGKGVRYTRDDLLKYLARERIEPRV